MSITKRGANAVVSDGTGGNYLEDSAMAEDLEMMRSENLQLREQMSQLREESIDLKEQNNMLELKMELLLDMVSIFLSSIYHC